MNRQQARTVLTINGYLPSTNEEYRNIGLSASESGDKTILKAILKLKPLSIQDQKITENLLKYPHLLKWLIKHGLKINSYNTPQEGADYTYTELLGSCILQIIDNNKTPQETKPYLKSLQILGHYRDNRQLIPTGTNNKLYWEPSQKDQLLPMILNSGHPNLLGTLLDLEVLPPFQPVTIFINPRKTKPLDIKVLRNLYKYCTKEYPYSKTDWLPYISLAKDDTLLKETLPHVPLTKELTTLCYNLYHEIKLNTKQDPKHLTKWLNSIHNTKKEQNL